MRARSKSVIVDFCSKCKGIWFNSCDFGQFVKALSQSEQIKPEKTLLYHKRQVKSIYALKEGQRACPNCGRGMQKFNYSGDSNIFLDKCPNCDGVWADAGEAQAIAGYLKEDPQTTAIGRTIAESMVKPELEPPPRWTFYLLYLPRVIVPFSDDVPRERFPFVTIALIVFCAILFAGQRAVNPDEVARGLGVVLGNRSNAEVATLMLAQGGIFHLICNMLFLWLFGDNVEDRFSRCGYLLFFIFAGAATTLFYLLVRTEASASAVGMSGAVSAIMGAYFVFYPTANVKFFVVACVMEIPAAVCLGLWLLFHIFALFLFKSDIAVCGASIVGFVLGAIVAFIRKTLPETKQQE